MCVDFELSSDLEDTCEIMLRRFARVTLPAIYNVDRQTTCYLQITITFLLNQLSTFFKLSLMLCDGIQNILEKEKKFIIKRLV